MARTMPARRARHRAGGRFGPAKAAGLAVAAVWMAMIAISLFAPDMIHGSEHEHLRIGALTAWFWGLIATVFVLLPLIAYREPLPHHDRAWLVFGLFVGGAWAIAAVAGVAAPRAVTGSDPTEVPVAALVAPVAALVVTAAASVAVGLRVRGP